MKRFNTDEGCIHGFIVCARCDREMAEFLVAQTRGWVRNCLEEARARGLYVDDYTRDKRREDAARFIVENDKEQGQLYEYALGLLEEIEWRAKQKEKP